MIKNDGSDGMVLKKSYVNSLRRQHYKLFGKGEHSATKLCLWTRKSIKQEGFCYKQKFYGIQSHRCLQMTPNIYCNQRCIYCWRSWESEPLNYFPSVWDSPKTIVEESIKAQGQLLTGLGGIPERIDKKKYMEAHNPKHVAISLTGEPTIYPKIKELIDEYHKAGLTTFLVTNGMLPEVIEKVSPTQMYVSLGAPNEKIQRMVDMPLFKGAWERLNQTLELLPSLKTRKVIRITAVKGLNMVEPRAYAELIEKSQADFLEIKSYMYVGSSRKRLKIENMPRHEDIKDFALKINEHLGYEFLDEQPISRVVLLSSGEKEPKISFQ